MKILITGATGYIGRRLTNELIKDGADIRIFVRNKAKLERSMLKSCEVTEGSTFEPEALALALQGVHTAYYLIHSMGKSGDFEDMDRQSAELFRDVCIDAGGEKDYIPRRARTRRLSQQTPPQQDGNRRYPLGKT